MATHPKNFSLDARPIELFSLNEALAVAPPSPNWVLTEAEKRINREVLATILAISQWPDPKFAGLFLRNAIAAAKFDDHRARPKGLDWIPVDADSPVSALLIQFPLYKWQIPRDHGCFHPFCDHMVTDQQSSHLQRAHNRKRIVPSEENSKVKRVWNGE
jgi:hypothetical protein